MFIKIKIMLYNKKNNEIINIFILFLNTINSSINNGRSSISNQCIRYCCMDYLFYISYYYYDNRIFLILKIKQSKKNREIITWLKFVCIQIINVVNHHKENYSPIRNCTSIRKTIYLFYHLYCILCIIRIYWWTKSTNSMFITNDNI